MPDRNLRQPTPSTFQPNSSPFTIFLRNHKCALWIAILTITLLWGYAWVLMKEGIAYMGPFTFSAFRFGTGSITMLFVVWTLKTGLPPKTTMKQLILLRYLQNIVLVFVRLYGSRFVDCGQLFGLPFSMPF